MIGDCMSTFLIISACIGLVALLIRLRVRGQTWPNAELLVEAMQMYLLDDPTENPSEK